VRNHSLICALIGVCCAQAQTTLLDNAWLSATRYTLAPHEKLRRATIAINLTSGETTYLRPGSPAEENRTNAPVEEILIELKPNAPPLPHHAITLDPTKLDAHHHVIIFENDRVRIVRNTLEPHVLGPMHEHSSYLVIYLTDLHTTVTQTDGTIRDNIHKRGELTWRDYTKHATENVGPLTAHEIQIELK
jgi:hypothetical protein